MADAAEVAASLLYEDEELRVRYLPGRSAHLLVTFGDLVSTGDTEGVFAEKPARKAGMSCLGFMARRGNWYPAASMRAALRAVAEVLARHRRVVAYGGSMGGYAAIKYAAALRAEAVLALCPQWSIDTSECDGFDPGWQSHFQPAMRGMGIGPDDVAGAIFVAADMTDGKDRFHATRIAQCGSGVVVINVPRVGHHVTPMIAGTENLQRLVEAALKGDGGAIAAVLSRSRRRFPGRVARVVNYARARFPKRVNARACDAIEAGTAERVGDAIYPALAHCVTEGDLGHAARLLRHFAAATGDVADQWRAVNYAAERFHRPYVLRTHHGSMLCFSQAENRLLHATALQDDLAPIRLAVDGRSFFMFSEWGDCRTYFALREERLAPTLWFDECARLDLRPATSHRFAASIGGRFLCAEPPVHGRGRLRADRPAPRQWEEFSFDFA